MVHESQKRSRKGICALSTVIWTMAKLKGKGGKWISNPVHTNQLLFTYYSLHDNCNRLFYTVQFSNNCHLNQYKKAIINKIESPFNLFWLKFPSKHKNVFIIIFFIQSQWNKNTIKNSAHVNMQLTRNWKFIHPNYNQRTWILYP